jgi:hypothetical protein
MFKLGGKEILAHTGGTINYELEDMTDFNTDSTFYHLCLGANYTVASNLLASEVRVRRRPFARCHESSVGAYERARLRLTTHTLASQVTSGAHKE